MRAAVRPAGARRRPGQDDRPSRPDRARVQPIDGGLLGRRERRGDEAVGERVGTGTGLGDGAFTAGDAR